MPFPAHLWPQNAGHRHIGLQPLYLTWKYIIVSSPTRLELTNVETLVLPRCASAAKSFFLERFPLPKISNHSRFKSSF